MAKRPSFQTLIRGFTDVSMTGFGATYANDFLLGTWKLPGVSLTEWAWSEHWASPLTFFLSH